MRAIIATTMFLAGAVVGAANAEEKFFPFDVAGPLASGCEEGLAADRRLDLVWAQGFMSGLNVGYIRLNRRDLARDLEKFDVPTAKGRLQRYCDEDKKNGNKPLYPRYNDVVNQIYLGLPQLK